MIKISRYLKYPKQEPSGSLNRTSLFSFIQILPKKKRCKSQKLLFLKKKKSQISGNECIFFRSAILHGTILQINRPKSTLFSTNSYSRCISSYLFSLFAWNVLCFLLLFHCSHCTDLLGNVKCKRKEIKLEADGKKSSLSLSYGQEGGNDWGCTEETNSELVVARCLVPHCPERGDSRGNGTKEGVSGVKTSKIPLCVGFLASCPQVIFQAQGIEAIEENSQATIDNGELWGTEPPIWVTLSCLGVQFWLHFFQNLLQTLQKLHVVFAFADYVAFPGVEVRFAEQHLRVNWIVFGVFLQLLTHHPIWCCKKYFYFKNWLKKALLAKKTTKTNCEK